MKFATNNFSRESFNTFFEKLKTSSDETLDLSALPIDSPLLKKQDWEAAAKTLMEVRPTITSFKTPTITPEKSHPAALALASFYEGNHFLTVQIQEVSAATLKKDQQQKKLLAQLKFITDTLLPQSLLPKKNLDDKEESAPLAKNIIGNIIILLNHLIDYQKSKQNQDKNGLKRLLDTAKDRWSGKNATREERENLQDATIDIINVIKKWIESNSPQASQENPVKFLIIIHQVINYLLNINKKIFEQYGGKKKDSTVESTLKSICTALTHCIANQTLFITQGLDPAIIKEIDPSAPTITTLEETKAETTVIAPSVEQKTAKSSREEALKNMDPAFRRRAELTMAQLMEVVQKGGFLKHTASINNPLAKNTPVLASAANIAPEVAEVPEVLEAPVAPPPPPWVFIR